MSVLKRFIIFFLIASSFVYAIAEEHRSFIDTHAHVIFLSNLPPFMVVQDPVSEAIETMDNFGIEKSILMPMPFNPNNPQHFDYERLAPIAKSNSKFAFMGGGGTLNTMIQESGSAVSDAQRENFRSKAEEILRSGAIGFGEMAAEHLSFQPGQPYEAAPPDHPLFLLLADIAAEHDVPIELHMEAVAHDMTTPARFANPPNPGILHENIKAFERLLAHNPKAKIVWAHAGWDNIGERTVALMRRLLLAHPNLYMNIKLDRQSIPENRPLDETGRIRPEWIDLISAFPDRFCIGVDELYGMPALMGMAHGPRIFLDQLPSDLAKKIGIDNAIRIYKL